MRFRTSVAAVIDDVFRDEQGTRQGIFDLDERPVFVGDQREARAKQVEVRRELSEAEILLRLIRIDALRVREKSAKRRVMLLES
jgi:hypothetical protein